MTMSSRQRDIGRTFQSGAQKRKSEAEKARRIEAMLTKVPKITNFFRDSNFSAVSNNSHTTSISSLDADLRSVLVSDKDITCTDKHATSSEGVLLPFLATSITPVDELTHVETGIYSHDPAQWTTVEQSMREYFACNPPSQNIGDFSISKRAYGNKIRYAHQRMFQRQMSNGEARNRPWLIYSPSTGSLFCYICKRFSLKDSVFTTTGFNDWTHSQRTLEQHESSISHRDAVILSLRLLKPEGRVDSQLALQIDSEKQYWRHVLQRVVSVIKFLAERGLAFRGKKQTFGVPTKW